MNVTCCEETKFLAGEAADDREKSREELLVELRQLRLKVGALEEARGSTETGADLVMLEQKFAERTRAFNKSQAELFAKHEQLMILFAQVELAKKQWEKTMDCISDLVILVGSDGKVRRCNRAVAELTGMPHAKLLGAQWEALIFNEEMDTGGYAGCSGELFHSSSGRWFKLTSYPFIAGDKEGATGAVITLHDTTEIKGATTALQEAYAELKSTQTQMLQREKMASIGQLAAGIAHEINNPMGFITSNIRSLDRYVTRLIEFIGLQKQAAEGAPGLETPDDLSKVRKQLKIDYIINDVGQLIRESLEGADRVKKIVQDLKTFSRVDEADYKHANINECLESTLNIASNELKYKATLHKDFGTLPLIRCYPQQLNQVFLNLLVNAAQAIEKQGDISVRTWEEEGAVMVAVADTGCGIPEESLSRIFEPFFTSKEVGKGTGLGLSITYDIVKKHNGDIIVDSRPGEGTTFTVRLPIVERRDS